MPQPPNSVYTRVASSRFMKWKSARPKLPVAPTHVLGPMQRSLLLPPDSAATCRGRSTIQRRIARTKWTTGAWNRPPTIPTIPEGLGERKTPILAKPQGKGGFGIGSSESAC